MIYSNAVWSEIAYQEDVYVSVSYSYDIFSQPPNTFEFKYNVMTGRGYAYTVRGWVLHQYMKYYNESSSYKKQNITYYYNLHYYYSYINS